MELPDLGKLCSEPNCKRLEYLPLRCISCKQIFCSNHVNNANHSCPNANKNNIQDFGMRCSEPICKQLEFLPVKCIACKQIFCSNHVNNANHSCHNANKNNIPDLGMRCSEPICKRLEFLPIKCTACKQIFCSNHVNYATHSCPNSSKNKPGVPVFPLCGSPVPTTKYRSRDVPVRKHINGPAKVNRKRNRCHIDGCKMKELIPVLCKECRKNFCLRHRFPRDHECSGRGDAALLNSGRPAANYVHQIQGALTEEEALARALAESMEEQQPRPSRRVPRPTTNNECQMS